MKYLCSQFDTRYLLRIWTKKMERKSLPKLVNVMHEKATDMDIKAFKAVVKFYSRRFQKKERIDINWTSPKKMYDISKLQVCGSKYEPATPISNYSEIFYN